MIIAFTLMKNYVQAIIQYLAETQELPEEPKSGYLFDSETQIVVLQKNVPDDMLQEMFDRAQAFVAAYDTPPGTAEYPYQNLSEYLAKTPGAKATSYSLNNYSAEPLCHFFRSMYGTLTHDVEQTHPVAWFIDETSKKLIVAGNLPDQMIDDEKIGVQFDSFIAKFVELCDAGQ